MKIIKKTFAASLLCAAAAKTVTRVTVLEIGEGGVVRQTGSSQHGYESAEAVRSFWSSLHGDDGRHHHETYPSMSMVPDFFHRADGGLILGFNEPLGNMEEVQRFSSKYRVGEFAVLDEAVQHVLPDGTGVVKYPEDLEYELKSSLEMFSDGNHLKKLSFTGPVFSERILSSFLVDLAKLSKAHGKTLIVHLVYNDEEDDTAAVGTAATLPEQTSRRLQNAGTVTAKGSIFNGFSYYKDGKVLYSPSKTIYEIQTFNVYMWTAIGLFLVVFTGVSKFANMQLYPDTLLFGEAGKPIE